MKRSAILRLDNEIFSKSTLTQLEAAEAKSVAKSPIEATATKSMEAPPETETEKTPPESKRSKIDSKKMNEDMKSADRFFFNQYFPIKEAFLSD